MTSTCNCCSLLKNNETPSVWCLQCEQALCSSCEQYHFSSTASRDHNTVLFDVYQKLPNFVRNLEFKCEEHAEKYQHYCRNDDKPICKTCKVTSHKKCPDTPDIDDVIRNVKSSFVLEETHDNTEKIYTLLLNGTEDRRKNLTNLQNQRNELLTDIEKSKETIIEHLNELERAAKAEVENTYAEIEKKVSNTLQILTSLEKLMREIVDGYNEMKTNASNLQTFIAIKEIERTVQNASTHLTKMSSDGDFSQVLLTYAHDHEQMDILLQLKSFGKVEKRKSKPVIAVEMNEANTGQFENTNHVKVEMKRDIKLDPGYYFGCCTLSSGLIVVADFNNVDGTSNLKVLNEDGSIKYRFDMPENGVYDVTEVDNNHVAASGYWKKRDISIVNINDGSVNKTFHTSVSVRGLSHKDGKVLFCAANQGIKELNLKDGKINDVIDDNTVHSISYISTSNDRICYTCPYKNKVTVLDSQYNVLFNLEDDSLLIEPRGITIDDRMNIYVAGYRSSNVVVLSPDGKTRYQILTEGNGLNAPSAVHYDRPNKHLVVVAYYRSKIQIYDVL